MLICFDNADKNDDMTIWITDFKLENLGTNKAIFESSLWQICPNPRLEIIIKG